MSDEPPDSALPEDLENDKLEVTDAASLEKLESINEGVIGIAEAIDQMPDLPMEMRRLIELLRRESYSGPLPPPEILEGYKAAYSDAPAVIFNELVEQGAHRRKIETEAIGRQEARADRGQHYALVIVILVLAVCVLAVLKHQPWVGAALFSVTLASIVGSFIYGSRRQDSDLRQKRRTLDKVPSNEDGLALPDGDADPG